MKRAEVEVCPLNLDSLLGKPRNRVARLGVELEGGWVKVPEGIHLEGDGSVFRGAATPPEIKQKGELQLGPMQPAALSMFLKKYYPIYVDNTCGMHVHLSFANLLHYDWLMIPEYQETVLCYLTKWAKTQDFPEKHHIWERLAGKSVYCQKKFWPDAQVKSIKDHDQTRHGHRYTVVHYCGRLRTIEIRVLPMMKAYKQALEAIRLIVDITNASLVKLAKREERVSGQIQLPSGGLYEEYLEEELPIRTRKSWVING
jgi:hypothetical protein